MADPIVHITNGIPDAGTGNITTLGQTLVDGANFTLGSSTDLAVAAGAVGTISAKLRSISRDIAGGIVLQAGGNTIGAVNQGTSPWVISGSVSVTGTTTVTGTVAATQSGTWNINNISGTISLPTGAATAAKQPALGVAGTPSSDVLTVQGAAGMTALKVDGSAVTQPISGNVGITGNVNCVQSGTWNVGITGTVSVVQGGNFTTRIVGNTGSTIDFSSAQNQSTPSAAILIGGEFNTVPTTITNGNASPLQLDSSANLLVNVKASTTIPVSQSGTWTVQPGNVANTTAWLTTIQGMKDSGGTEMTDTVNHALKVNIVAGAGSGGTASTVGAAVPGTATAAGFSDGTNMQLARVFDGDSGAGTQWDIGVLLKTPASGGAVDIGVSGQPLRVDPTGTTTQPISGSVSVTGTATVTGTVTANQGGAPWTMKPDGTVWSLTSTSANVNVTNTSIAVTGTFWQATQPVSGTVTANQGGTWNITNISGTVSLPTGAATSANQPTASALGAATSGQTGTLALGAVTSAAPSYTTATSNALSLTTAGALRVDASAVTQPVSGTVTANQGGTWTTRIVGNAGAVVDGVIGNATAPANMIVTGAVFNTTKPTLTTGQSAALQANSSGILLVDGTGGTFPVTGTVTVTQGTAGNLNATVVQSGTWTVQQGTPPWQMQGDVGAGSADSGFPIKIGGFAKTTNPSAVSDGQRQNALFDKQGKLIVNGALRQLKGKQKTSITTTTETTVVTAGGAGVFNDVYAVVVTNKSATTVFVDFKDSTGGTTQLTLSAPANDTRGFTVPVDSAIPQTTAANNWTATLSAPVTSIEITVLYVSNL